MDIEFYCELLDEGCNMTEQDEYSIPCPKGDKRLEGKKSGHSTICWDCEKQCGKCDWSREFKPVEGWKAIPTKIVTRGRKYNDGMIDSYNVYECPEFELRERLKKMIEDSGNAKTNYMKLLASMMQTHQLRKGVNSND